MLTALVDDLTAEASAPVDRLAGAALAVSKAEPGEKIQQQSNFEMQADELKARVARVRTHASKAVENSRHTSKVRYVRVTGDFIDRLTPQVIAAARALAGEITLGLVSKVRFRYRNMLDASAKTLTPKSVDWFPRYGILSSSCQAIVLIFS